MLRFFASLSSTGPALRMGAQSLLFWAVAAAVLASSMPGLGSFWRVLLIVECVGSAGLICASLLWTWPPLHRLPRSLRWALVTGPSLVLGYVLGHIVAFTLLGEPVFLFGSGRERMVPIAFTLISAALGLLYFATRDRLAREQAVAAQAELRLLRAQLEPHMLFNTLATLRSLVDEDPPQAGAMMDRLIVFLRGVLAASRTESQSLAQEFEQLRAYLDLMRWRMGPRLSVELDLPDDLRALQVPALLLQPLVENAIRHGLEPQVGPGHLRVQARCLGQFLQLQVSDTGQGLPQGLPKPPGGYGLQSVRERLTRAHGAAAVLQVQAVQPHGLCVTLLLPL